MNNDTTALVEVRNVSKQFAGFFALKEVSFSVRPGEVHALLGENGAGKSTLVKILTGVEVPDEGSYLVDGREVEVSNPRAARDLGINVVFQELNLVPGLSAAENIAFGRLPTGRFGKVNWKGLYADAEKRLAEVGLDIDPRRRVGLLSVAQQQLVEIARGLSHASRVIAMDEPTSALSYQETERLFELIRDLASRGVGIVYVSHKLDELFQVTDRITVLRDGRMVGEVVTSATTEEELIRLMVGREVTSLYSKAANDPGDVLLEVRGLESTVVKQADFEVRAGEVVGFSGLMGAGRTELARALMGLDETTAGEILLGGSPIARNSPPKAVEHGLGYLPESRKDDGLMLDASLKANMTLAILKRFVEHGRIDRGRERAEAQEAIGTLGIRARSVDQKVRALSGGNQQKVVLARWLINRNLKLLILDEPTRGIDVGSKSEIYQLVANLAVSGVGVIVMSSDLLELLSVCDRIYVMKGGRIAGEYSREEATQEALMSTAIGGG